MSRAKSHQYLKINPVKHVKLKTYTFFLVILWFYQLLVTLFSREHTLKLFVTQLGIPVHTIHVKLNEVTTQGKATAPRTTIFVIMASLYHSTRYQGKGKSNNSTAPRTSIFSREREKRAALGGIRTHDTHTSCKPCDMEMSIADPFLRAVLALGFKVESSTVEPSPDLPFTYR